MPARSACVRCLGVATALLLGGSPEGALADALLVGQDFSPSPRVRTFADLDVDGTYETQVAESVVLGPACRGARLATGDLDGDSQPELIVGCGPKGESRVGIYQLEPDGSVGGLRESFLPFADFKGGVFVATADLDGDGRDELFVGQDRKGTGEVRIYSDLDGDGLLQTELTDSFQPLGAFAGGVRLAGGNLDADASEELAVGNGPGGAPRVVVFGDSDLDRQLSDETALDEIAPFDAKVKGVYVAAGALEVGRALFVGAGSGPALVRVFCDTDANGLFSNDAQFDEVPAYDKSLGGGVRVAAFDSDHSGIFAELVTVPGKSYEPTLKIFDDDGDGDTLLSNNPQDDEFAAFDEKTRKGLFVAGARPGPGRYASTATPQFIVDQATLVSSIFVPPSADVVRDLEVFLGIAHTFDGDLDVSLTHVPSGTSVTLFTDVGGTDEGMLVILNDEAGTDIGTANNPTDGAVSGQFNLEDPAVLNAFDGLDASGEWRLTVVDDNINDTGTLLAWELKIAY
jgi:subtilisin-like proprotein convertase family protein